MALNASSHVVVLDVRVKGGAQAATQMSKTAAATEQAGVKAEKTKREFASLAGAFTALFAAGMVRRGFESLVKPALEFDTALTRLRTITGANADTMKAYEARARSIAAITPYGPIEMVATLQELRRATGSTDVALEALEGTAKIGLATMGKMGLAGATRMTTETIKTFGLNTGQVTDAMERLAALSLATGSNLENFETVMARLGTAATVTGQSLDQVLMLATLSGRGVAQPTRNVQLLSSALKMLQQKEARAALEGIGVEVMGASGAMRDLTDIFTDLGNRMLTEPVKVRAAMTAAFGQRGGESVGAVLNQLTGSFKDVDGKVLKSGQVFDYLRDKVRESGGVLDKMGKDWLNSAAGQFELFNEKVNELLRSLGAGLMPMFVSLAQVLGGVAQAFSSILNNPVGKFIFQGAGSTLAVIGGAWALKALWFGISKIFLNVASNIGLIAVNATAATAALSTMSTAGTVAATAGGVAGVAGTAVGAVGAAGAARAAWRAAEAKKAAAASGGRLATAGRIAGGLAPLGIGLAVEGLSSYFGGLGEAIVDKLKKGETLSWWEKQWWKGGRSLLNEDQLKILDQQIVKHKEINKELELAVRHKKDAHEIAKLDLAGYSSAASYKPPIVKTRVFASFENKLRAASKGLAGDDRRAANYALQASTTARTLMKESTRGPLSSIKHGQLLNALEMMRSVGTDINLRGAPGAIGGGLLENFGKDVFGQVAAMSTPENQRYFRNLAMARGMNYPGLEGQQIPGTSAAAGGYGDAPGSMLMRDYPWHAGAYPSKGAQDRTKMEAIAQQTLTEAGYQRTVMERVLDKLSHPLEVTVAKSDPMGGQSKPDYFPG